MIQIFILGSSSVYGVGSENGGWADLIKQQLHKKMYSKNGIGEKIEIYNFGKSGATIDFVLENFPSQLKAYSRNKTTVAIVSVGGNNAKAENQPENYVSSLEEYKKQKLKLLQMLKSKCTHVISVGGGFFDELKTFPKYNPLNGGKSYFSNERKQLFEREFERISQELSIPFISVGVSKKEWLEKYLFDDGLHPNQKGYNLIAEKVRKVLDEIVFP